MTTETGIWGVEQVVVLGGSTKSAVALKFIAGAQAENKVCCLIDVAKEFDVTWAKTCGVDVAGLLVSQPDGEEQVIDILDRLVATSAIDLIVIDGPGPTPSRCAAVLRAYPKTATSLILTRRAVRSGS